MALTVWNSGSIYSGLFKPAHPQCALCGASGNGKTYIACALGNAACRRFKKVRYIGMPELLDELSIARA
ncbi:ATP-binding protein [Desulfitobacterium hafniense]|uniref:ATP-binding protein n=1 Tax=Desulfitobacterium hafniense TaxID=49338 RepID=UPI000A7FF1CA